MTTHAPEPSSPQRIAEPWVYMSHKDGNAALLVQLLITDLFK